MVILGLSKPWLVPAAIVLAAFGCAAAYLAFADDRYEARAIVQISPVARDDETFAGFSVFREGGDGKSPLETAAALVEASGVAAAVAVRLGADREDLLDAVEPVTDDEASTLTIRARAGGPRRAAQIANAFAAEFVAQRSARFQADLSGALARLRARLRAFPQSQRDEAPALQLAARLAELEGYLGESDPTAAVVSDALAPAKPAWPRAFPVLATAAGVALLALGLGLVPPLVARRRRVTPAVGPGAEREAAFRAEELARLQTQFDERVDAVVRRERELAEQSGRLAARERELAERDSTPSASAGAAAPESAGQDEPGPDVAPSTPAVPAHVPPVTAPAAGTTYLSALERLVAERGAAFPDRLDEWQAYLFHLRSHASNEGALPASFDALVEEVFGELLEP